MALGHHWPLLLGHCGSHVIQSYDLSVPLAIDGLARSDSDNGTVAVLVVGRSPKNVSHERGPQIKFSALSLDNDSLPCNQYPVCLCTSALVQPQNKTHSDRVAARVVLATASHTLSCGHGGHPRIRLSMPLRKFPINAFAF